VKPIRWIAGFDLHGDMQDAKAVRVFVDFCRQWKPTIRIMGGDLFDFRWLRGRASEGEKRERITDDFEAGVAFLKAFKPTHFLHGNHDHRLVRVIRESDDGKLKALCERMHADLQDSLGDMCRVYPYDKRKGVMRLGDVNVIHGYHTGMYAARNAAAVYGSCLMGHVHANDMFAIPALEPRIGRCVGSLCLLDMEYNHQQAATLRQEHGFAYGLVDRGATIIFQAWPTNGIWHLPTEFREVRYAATDARRDG
jgi:hypothetical protein